MTPTQRGRRTAAQRTTGAALMRLFSKPAVILASVAALAACGASPRVARVYDGRLVEGRFITPDAYAAFLRGVLAEDSGDLRGALAAYAQALEEDTEEPAIWAHLGEARCKLDPKDPEIDRAFAQALKRDANSAGALAAKGRCALARGNAVEAAELARRASAEDPKNVGLTAFAVRVDASRGDPAARERAIALTREHGEYAAAWDALIAWGYARKDADLVARGLAGLVHVAPARSTEVEKGALALLDGGQPALARALAVAVADAPRDLGVIGPRDATVARLAVDEALARGDRAVALARATRGHVSVAEVAARALLLDHRDLAASIAAAVADADPSASGAVMVKGALKASGPAPLATAPPAAGKNASVVPPAAPSTDSPPEICALVFADYLAASVGIEAARVWLARITRTPMAPRDPLTGPLAVDLATRGVLPIAALPAELRASVQRARASE